MKSSSRSVWSAGLLLSWLLVAPPAWADADSDARDLFNAGVAAYNDGKFMAAAQAFLQAHQLVPKPELLFSAAQAFRRQFDSDGEPTPLRMAVKYYGAYVAEVKEGGRRVEAARALGELRPLLREGEGASEMSFPTNVSVTSSVKGAVVSIDGGPWRAVPYNGEIAPGPHRALVRASGYHEGSREFVAEKGRVAPVDVPLRGMPPLLDVTGADGADIVVDGKLLGTAPLAQSIELEPGVHLVSIATTGYKPYAAELEFTYGTTTHLALDLPATNQRRLAWGVLGTAGVTFVAAGVLGGLAFAAQEEARDVEQAQVAGPIREEDRLAHNDAIDRRDDLRLATAVVGGAGAAIAITGAFLFFFDEPAPAMPATRGKERDAPSDEPPGGMPPGPTSPAVELMGAPALAADGVGFTLLGRF
jgi:hypothetical protein